MGRARRCREDVSGTEPPERDVQRGRPSLTGEPAASPHVGFRVSPELRRHADALARQQGITLSQLARDALEQYVRGA